MMDAARAMRAGQTSAEPRRLHLAGRCYNGREGETCDGLLAVRPGRRDFRVGVAAMLAVVALAVAGCSSFSKPKAEPPPPDPNAFPADYRSQITAFLRQSLTDRADFRGALISPPTLRPIGDSQRYTACMKFNGRTLVKTKIAIYLGGQMTQFIDADAAQCAGAAYEPFRELEAAMPPQ
jgi:hypothetical protein